MKYNDCRFLRFLGSVVWMGVLSCGGNPYPEKQVSAAPSFSPSVGVGPLQGPSENRMGLDAQLNAQVAHQLTFDFLGGQIQDQRILPDFASFGKKGFLDTDGGRVEENSVVENQIIFRSVVLYPLGFLKFGGKKHRKVFLVWPDTWQNQKIHHSSYVLESRNGFNEFQGDLQVKVAHHDAFAGYWFIDLEEILDPFDVHPESEQRLGLFLNLGASSAFLRVSFHVQGLLPPVPDSAGQLKNELFQPGERTVQQSLSRLVNQPTLFFEERLTNPSSRKLLLWVKSDEKISFTTFLSHSFPEQPHFKRVLQTHHYARASFRVRQILIESVLGARNQGVNIDDWFALELPPKTQVVLKWLMEVSPGTPQCQLPEDHIEARFGVIVRGVPGYVDHWDVVGWKLEGRWKREAVVTDAGMDQRLFSLGVTEQVSPELHTRLERQINRLSNEEKSLSAEAGTTFSNSEAFPCQGVFR